MNKSSQPNMLGSNAYQRLRAESPKEFEPKTVFFCSEGEGEGKSEAIDWQNSFWLKAAVVYHAITGSHVNPRATPKASWLLIAIAKNCCLSAAATPPATESVSTAPAKPEEINEEFIRKLLAEEKKFIDGVYLVVGFLPALKSAVGNEWDRDKTNEFYVSTRSHEIVTDIIKIGNQIPLDCIFSVVEHVGDAIKKAKDAFLASDASDTDNKDLRDTIDDKYQLSFSKDNFHEVLSLFCWYYSPFYYKAAPATNVKFLKEEVAKKSNLLECVHEYVMRAWGKESGTALGGAEGSGYVYSVPTAKRLRRAGVRFVAADAVFHFNEPVLKLPSLMFDFKAETVVRNLLALELLRGDYQKPLTRYFQFMNELVEDIGDVKVLRRAGVIHGGSKAGLEVLEMVKKINGFATYPSIFAPIDNEIKKAREFHEKRMKSFLVRHQPAVLWVSSVAAASVIATAVFASRRRARRD